MRRREGFTLIELLVTTALVALVAVYLLQTFTVNHRAYVVVDQVAESQQNLRTIADLIERDIRHAGLMVPESAAVCGVDNLNVPDVLYVSDADAIDPANDTATYSGARLVGAVSDVSGPETIELAELTLEATARPAYDANGDGANDSDFQKDGGVIVIDLNDLDRGSACGRVDAVDVPNEELDITIVSGGLGAAGGAAQLTAVPAHEYRIAGGRLLRDGLVLAEGVEDLQVAYFFDDDGDDVVDANEYRGDGAGDDYAADSLDAQNLREVRVNLVTRTRREDDQFSTGQFQALENRNAVAGSDGFRRRVHTTTVMLRNVGNRIAGL